MTDSDVETAVQARFDADPQLRAAGLAVNADVEQNEITLSGTVGSREMRTQALEIAGDIQPELRIVDRIEVEPPELSLAEFTEDMAAESRRKAEAMGDKIGSSIEDAWIHAKLTTKLITDGDTPARRINVDVMENVVTLRGEVATPSAKEEAGRIARETGGVKDVKNMLEVKG